MVSISTILATVVYAVALTGLLPLAPYLERTPAAIVTVAFLWGVYGERRATWLNARLATVAAIVCSAWYLLQVTRQNVATPMVSIAVLLLAVRFVTAKSHRHHLQIMALSLFCLAASSLYGLSPYFLIFLLVQLLLMTIALVLLTFYQRDPDFRLLRSELTPLLKTALAIPLATLPLMVFFFFILPRTQTPLWDLLARAGSERAGVSDSVQPGDKAAIATGGGVVFRAAMDRLPPDRLYWRCMVLNSFDGKTWKRVTPPATDTPLQQGTELTVQTLFLEPGRTPFYPGLDIPQQLSGVRGVKTGDNLFQPYVRGGTRLKYTLQSALGTGPRGQQKKIDRSFYTALPGALPARLVQTGQKIARGAADDREKIDRLEQFFSSSRLSYGTTGLPTGDDAMEEFLFRSRKGHCELFATTFALLLRIAGVPARLVGGYLGGEYSDLGGYYLVTDERAHLWVEAWVEGSGWIRIDPSRLTESFVEVTGRGQRSLQSRFAVYLDALNYYWNSTIINYDLERQVAMVTSAGAGLKQLSVPKVSASGLLRFALAGALLATVIFIARRTAPTAEERLLRRFHALLRRRYDVEIAANAGLHSAVAPLADPELDRFVAIYTNAIYHDRRLSKAELAELEGILKGIGGRS